MSEHAGTPAPDVLGLTLDEAAADLAALGLRPRVEETKPPGADSPEGPARVVRQRLGGSEVVLTVTYERYAAPAERTQRRRPASP
jgi:hypothetical protein